MDKNSELIIVDLDGTFILTNSFQEWVYFVLSRTFFYNTSLFFKLLGMAFRRKILKSMSHVDFKRKINSLDYPEHILEEFGERLNKKISKKVLNTLLCIKKNKPQSIFILSTAAPECYLNYFVNYLSVFEFDHVFCSKEEDGRFLDNYRESKLSAIINNFPLSEYVLFTDHSDDIFLAREAAQVYLCNASLKVAKMFDDNFVTFFEVKDEGFKS